MQLTWVRGSVKPVSELFHLLPVTRSGNETIPSLLPATSEDVLHPTTLCSLCILYLQLCVLYSFTMCDRRASCMYMKM